MGFFRLRTLHIYSLTSASQAEQLNLTTAHGSLRGTIVFPLKEEMPQILRDSSYRRSRVVLRTR